MNLVTAPERGLLARFFSWAFSRVALSPEAEARLRTASQRGPVVYVLRTSSTLSALILFYVLRAAGLPRVTYVSHLNVVWWQRVSVVLRGLFGRQVPSSWTLVRRQRDHEEQAWLESTLQRGDSALLFLFRPRHVSGARISAGERSLSRLVRVQEKMSRPVQLVPVSLFYEQARENFRRSLVDFIFGPRTGPGRLRELLQFLGHRHETVVAIGDVIEASHASTDALRAETLKALNQQMRVVRGPRIRHREQVIASVLRDPDLREVIAAEAKRTQKPEKAVRAAAREYCREIAANQKDHYLRMYRYLLDQVFNRIYDGVVVDESGMERIREAAKDSTLVLAPCHKSHADYLILSYVLRVRGMQCPHIVAGINLSFWPLGPLFRGAGAFFVRRSFKGNALYGATFRAYVKRLLLEGTTMEFFPEGGRSRTGRLLSPKLGMFKYVVEAWASEGAPDMTIVPISVDYEKIIEHASYQAELAGGEKKREDLSSLFSTQKILRSRYGRVHVTLGTPIRLNQFARVRGLRAPEVGPKCGVEETTSLARALSFQVMHDIGKVATVTPSAVLVSVLLNSRRHSISKHQMYDGGQRLLEELRALGAPVSRALQPAIPALDEALKRFSDEKRVTVEHNSPDGNALLSIPSEHRLGLTYYQNTLTAHVLAHAIVALSALALGPSTVEELRAASLELSKMLKHEFSFRADRPFEALFGLVLTELVAHGHLQLGPPLTDPSLDLVTWGRVDALEMLASFLDATVGAYVATIDSLDELTHFPLWEKELVTRGMERVRAWLLDGKVRTAESLQKPLVQGALSWLKDLGVVVLRPDQTLTLSERFADPLTLDALKRHYARFVYGYPRQMLSTPMAKSSATVNTPRHFLS
jgi:glycerol-3-phosphate O-acyltransferase